MPATLTGDLQTLLTSAAFAPVDRAFLRITGTDATRWLNGMVTNSIQALSPGEGNYNLLLNAQGRIQGDCTIYREPDSREGVGFLLETDADQLETLQQLLDKFIIMDDVELAALSLDSTLLIGPKARLLLGDTASGDFIGATSPLPDPLELHRPYLDWQVTTPAQGLIPKCLIGVPSPLHGEAIRQGLRQDGALEASPETLEALRLLEARPRYSVDIRNTDVAKDLPQETNQPHALHFAKGCYLGQEIVERIRSRGQVHRLFTPFRLEGALPASLPAPLEANGKPAGELTSAVTVPTTEGAVTLALGYARREALDLKSSLHYASGIAHPRAAGSLF